MRKLALLACGIALLAALAGALLPPAGAQAPSPKLTINQVDATGFPSIQAIVTVLDSSGVPAPGLTPEQFKAFEGTSPLTIDRVQLAQDQGLSLATVIVIDVSGSMAGEPFNSAKAAASRYVDSMGTNDQAAILAFGDDVRTIVRLTGDHEALLQGIDSLQTGGNTALYEAVQTSAFIAGLSPAARRAVILLTDGENLAPASDATNDGSIAAAKGSNVPMFTIGFGDSASVGYLNILAAATGGAYRAATPETIGGVYEDIANLLRNQYVVNLTGSGSPDGKNASLQVVATVDGTPATGVLGYTRGAAPGVAPVPAAQSPVTPAVPASKSNTPATVFAVIVVVVGGAIGAWLLLMWNRRRRQRLEQLKVVEPNLRQAAAQPLDTSYRPLSPLVTTTNGATVAAVAGTGILRQANGSGDVYELGAGPTIIGTSPRASIVLPPSAMVAPEHLRIWLRGDHYVLHHVGGMTRKTYVGGHEADWVTLEPGDEVTVGPYKLIFEHPD